MKVKTRKFSEFEEVDEVKRVVGLTDGNNAIGGPGGGGGGGGAPASGTYIVKTPDSALPDAVALSDMPPGLLATDGSGELSSTPITGVPGEIIVSGGSGPFDPVTIGLDPDGSVGGGSISPIIPDAGHTFSNLDWVRHDGTSYALAQANTDTNAAAIGVIIDSIPGVSYRIRQDGYIKSFSALNPDLPYLPLVPGRFYFLSETDSGEASLTEPLLSRVCILADSPDSGWILPDRGVKYNADADPGPGPGPIPPSDNPNILIWTQPNASVDFAVDDLVTTFNDGGVGRFKHADNRNYQTSQVAGMVAAINYEGDPDKILIQTSGYANFLSGLTRETLYYLGHNGQMTSVRPSAPNEFARPVFLSLDDDDGFILEQQSLNASAGSDAEILLVSQPNAYWVGAVVRNSTGSSTYTLAQANNIANATTAGIVVWADASNFMIQQNGWVSGITHWSNQPGDTIVAGTKYWLSATNPGNMTPFEPENPGDVSKLMYVSNTPNFGQIKDQRPMLQPYASGGGGGGGSVKIASHDFASGETEVIFSGMFTNEFIAYEFVIDNLYVNQMDGYPRLRMQVGTGNPPVFDNVASHYRGWMGYAQGIVMMGFPYFAIGGTQGTGPSTRGPLNMAFKSNDLSSNEAENIKVFHGFSGMLGRISGSFESAHGASGSIGGSSGAIAGYSSEFPRVGYDSTNSRKVSTLFWSPHLAYPEPIQGAPPITALRFYVEGSVPGSFITKGSIRIYGYRR